MNGEYPLFFSGLLAVSATPVIQAETPSAIEYSANVILEAAKNMNGGISTTGDQLLRADASVTLNTAALNAWQGGQFYLQALALTGGDPSSATGDGQAYSNIAGDKTLKVFQAWYAQQLWDEKLTLLAGLHDLNSEFYVLEAAGLFTHSSLGIGPELSQTGASIFPTAGLAFYSQLKWQDYYLKAAVYDGIPGKPENPKGTHIHWQKNEGVMSIMEAGKHTETDQKWAVGVWRHTAPVENPVTGEHSENNQGVYVIGQMPVTDATKVFVQYGTANKQKNQWADYFGAGITHEGLAVEDDALGLAVAKAQLGAPYLQVNPDFSKAETAWNITYRYPLCPQTSLQTSVFYLQHPSQAPALDAATAVSLRLNWGF